MNGRMVQGGRCTRIGCILRKSAPPSLSGAGYEGPSKVPMRSRRYCPMIATFGEVASPARVEQSTKGHMPAVLQATGFGR